MPEEIIPDKAVSTIAGLYSGEPHIQALIRKLIQERAQFHWLATGMGLDYGKEKAKHEYGLPATWK